jgi:nucleoside-diphosphate-sugar epimerase
MPSTFLITGGAGLIGMALARRLVERGERVAIVDVEGSQDRVTRVLGELAKDVKVLEGDLADVEFTRRALANGSAETVVHLASLLGAVGNVDPVGATRTNCVGTAQVLEACSLWDTRRVVLASSIAVYGSDNDYERTDFPLTEDAPRLLAPGEPVYAGSKVFIEALGRHYARSSELTVCGLRPSVVFGAGRPISRIIDEPALGKPVKIADLARNTRLSYVYVEDVAAQFEALCGIPGELLVDAPFFNTGGEETTLGSIAEIVARQVTGATIDLADEGPEDILGCPAKVSDAALRSLGISRTFSLEEGIAHEINEARRLAVAA